VSSGKKDSFICKISSTGLFLWANKAGGIGDDVTLGVTVDSGGNSYIAGYFENTVSFGSINMVSSGYKDMFVSKVSSTGQYLRAIKSRGLASEQGKSIAIDTE
jgi:hypothetical protein